jgi:hypothetical protein
MADFPTAAEARYEQAQRLVNLLFDVLDATGERVVQLDRRQATLEDSVAAYCTAITSVIGDLFERVRALEARDRDRSAG